MNPEKILILTALRQERAAIVARLPKLSAFAVGIGAIRRPPPEILISAELVLVCGLGGGLDPILKPGDVVVDAPAGLLDWPDTGRGKIHTADRIVATPQEKRELFYRTGARVVEMEQAVVAGWVTAPVIGIRAVSDAADQSLDPRILCLVDPVGRLKPVAVAKLLAGSPAMVPALMRLNRDTKRALYNLADAVAAVAAAL